MKMLILCKRIPEVCRAVANRDFRRHLFEGRELQAICVGLVGLGNVGVEVARRLHSFKPQMVAYDPWSKHANEFQSLGGVMSKFLRGRTEAADIISLHTVLTDATKDSVNDEFFEHTKTGLLLVNTARGGVVNELSVLKAFDNGKLSYYATDFMCPEPPFDFPPEEHKFTHPFLMHPRVITTPHLAASTIDVQQRISLDLAQQILSNIYSGRDDARTNNDLLH
jgi:D-3-phosphoglycerate dehydrogenase